MIERQQWTALVGECKQCHRCALGKERNPGLFGCGSLDSQVMVIAPPPTVERRLMTHQAEALLGEILSLADVNLDQVYLTPLVKCPPPLNRGVMHIERHTCLHWLRWEAKLLAPKVIVCLGAEAVAQVMGEGVTLETHHGQWFARSGVEMMATYAPQDLLQNPNLRPDSFGDMKSLQKKLRQLHIL